ncbi:Xaa-Pro dipeptidase [Pseudidiomarina taiwanensis]|uniref:Xaa-Pro dipeptidase n=1 Tax=Pseudidiomarina taiwanensis TaxID=337250 RepID=A0A432ZC88_9GAMM|nr:Xaa-Pro dipeptidase [Pseudidiomarina taiwanensis]RUO75587.1 Xaa-Pro dipeptidase [Pseudidiomarina taiwanensis]
MTLYADHIATVRARFDQALAATGYDSVLIYSGQPRVAFLDDNPAPYKVNPLFKYWLPVTQSPKSAVFYKAGQKPVVYLHKPRDFWHADIHVELEPWQQYVDLRIVADVADIARDLGAELQQAAFIGEHFAEPVAQWPVAAHNPEALIHHLHFHRAKKTAWEIDNMRAANLRAATAHNAARDAFFAGASELEIHHAYLAAIDCREQELPYNSIVALNEHGAALHYDVLATQRPESSRSFLIDAGALYNGYCADITRTYARSSDTLYAELVQRVDQAQQELIAKIQVGMNYRQLHVEQHLMLAQILADLNVVKGTPESIYEQGYSSAFFPHGLGHFIGLQVHDVGGFLRNEQGDHFDRDTRHPFLRLLRDIEANQVFTIEPGLYIIDQLLEPFADNADFNWQVIDELRPYGGVRIEDSIVVKAEGPHENLSRNAFAQLG